MSTLLHRHSRTSLRSLLRERLQRRYGGAAAAPEVDWPANAVIEQLLDHRSVRAFAPQPLPDDALPLLVAAAQSAATSSNLQAWSVVAVQDPQRKARLAALANDQRHIFEAPLLLVWLADLSRLDRVAMRRGGPSEANRTLEMFLVAAIDAGLAAQNAVVAAESLGLGSVYIGALRNRPEALAAELGLPPRVFPLFGVCIGHPDPSRASGVKPRLPQGVVLHREQYGTAEESAAVQAYDEVLQAFQREQGLPEQPWSRQASARVRGAESLSGRDRLVDAAHALGFELE